MYILHFFKCILNFAGEVHVELVGPLQQFRVYVQGVVVRSVQGGAVEVVAQRQQGTGAHQSADPTDFGENLPDLYR